MSNKKTKIHVPEKAEEPKITEAVEPTIDATVEPEIPETESEEDIAIKKVGVVKDCGSLNIRIEPDIKSKSLGTIPVGEEVEIINECPDSDFYEVVYGSLSGFSMKKFIGLIAAEE